MGSIFFTIVLSRQKVTAYNFSWWAQQLNLKKKYIDAEDFLNFMSTIYKTNIMSCMVLSV